MKKRDGPWRNRGFSTIEFIIGAVMMTFIVFFPIAAEMQMHTIHTMEQELDRALQMAAVKGAVTPEIKRALVEDMKKRGITGVSLTPKTTTSPVPRGTIIHVGITVDRPTKSLYHSVMSMIGGNGIDSKTFTVSGSIMSEHL